MRIMYDRMVSPCALCLSPCMRLCVCLCMDVSECCEDSSKVLNLIGDNFGAKANDNSVIMLLRIKGLSAFYHGGGGSNLLVFWGATFGHVDM